MTSNKKINSYDRKRRNKGQNKIKIYKINGGEKINKIYSINEKNIIKQ